MCFSAMARETVTIIYGFSAADGAANYARTLVEQANRIRDRYTFIFDVRPGAGQTVAVNYVKTTPNTVFMASGGAYWIRPNFYPRESYDPNDMRTIMTQCRVPFAVSSGRYNSWSAVPHDGALTIGTSGLGVTSHLIALEIQKQYPNARIIPFKSTTDAILAAAGQQIDFAVGFVSEISVYSRAEVRNRLYILGITGSHRIDQYSTLGQQGFGTVLNQLVSPYNLMVPKSFPEAKAKEIREILVQAERSSLVRDSYKSDYCEPFQVEAQDLEQWQVNQNTYWSNLTKGVRLE